MNRSALLAIVLSLSGCQGRGPPANAYKRWVDRWTVRLGLGNLGIYPCHEIDRPGDCLKTDPPRRWRGLWFNEFEGSRFCPAPAQTCGPDSRGEQTYLAWETRFPKKWKALPYDRVYAVDFVGRRTSVRMDYRGTNYVIFGDRLISLNQVEPAGED